MTHNAGVVLIFIFTFNKSLRVSRGIDCDILSNLNVSSDAVFTKIEKSIITFSSRYNLLSLMLMKIKLSV